MERCDFTSVITTIRRFISDKYYSNQFDFICDMFEDFLDFEEGSDFMFDFGQICRWMNGLAKVSPKICHFSNGYGTQKNTGCPNRPGICTQNERLRYGDAGTS